MNDVNVIQLLTRFSDAMTEVEKWTNMIRYSNPLIPFFGIQFLVVVMDINTLTLGNVDNMKMSFKVAKLAICSYWLDSTIHHTYGRRIRSQLSEIFLLQLCPLLVLSWSNGGSATLLSKGGDMDGLRGQFSRPLMQSQKRQAYKAAFILLAQAW